MRRSRKKTRLRPDLTPLIDVVFLLLIFFIVASVFKKDETALELVLPRIRAGVSPDESREVVTIALKEDSLVLNTKPVQIGQLDFELKKIDHNLPVNLYVDKDTRYYSLAQVLELLAENSFIKVDLIMEKGKE